MNHISHNSELLSQDEREAQSLGLTYGKYKALTYTPSDPQNKPEKPQKRKHKQEYLKHRNRFVLWKKGLSDDEIASIVGVSRICIVRWRDIMEIPPAKKCADRDKYKLVDTEYGIYVVMEE